MSSFHFCWCIRLSTSDINIIRRLGLGLTAICPTKQMARLQHFNIVSRWMSAQSQVNISSYMFIDGKEKLPSIFKIPTCQNGQSIGQILGLCLRQCEGSVTIILRQEGFFFFKPRLPFCFQEVRMVAFYFACVNIKGSSFFWLAGD